MKLQELLSDLELVIQFFAGLDPNHDVRLAVQPGVVEAVVEPPKADEPAEVPATEEAPIEQKEGE